MKFAAPITGADVGLKREWIIGQHLNTLGDDGDEMSGAALHTPSSRALNSLCLSHRPGLATLSLLCLHID